MVPSTLLLWLVGRANIWIGRFDLWDKTRIVFNWHNNYIKWNISLLSIEVLEIKINEEFEPYQNTLDQRAT